MHYANGVHTITNEQYHSSDGVSRSALWLFSQSPMHYWHRYLNPERKPNKPNPNFLIGELVHCLVLEPDEFNKRYYIMEKVNKATKIGKAAYQNALDEAGLKTIISTVDAQIAQDMTQSAMSTSMADKLFGDAKVEKSIYFTHEPTGLQVKVRPDAWLDSIVTDLKTVKSGVYRDFQSSAFHYGYFLQAAMIQAALKSIDVDMISFIFYCVEKVAPYACTYYVIDDDALDYGTNQFNHIMERFADCKKKNKWGSYAPQTLSIPNYALREFNDD